MEGTAGISNAEHFKLHVSSVLDEDIPIEATDAIYAFIWQDEKADEEHEAWMKSNKKKNQKENPYFFAYLLRHDLTRGFYGSSYPRPMTDRMRKVWPLAQFLYSERDPAGFLGPGQYELDCVISAINYARQLGNTDWEDLPIVWNASSLDESFPHEYCQADEGFEEWKKSGEFEAMFSRMHHPDLEWEAYSNSFGPNGDPEAKNYIEAFFEAWELSCLSAFGKEQS